MWHTHVHVSDARHDSFVALCNCHVCMCACVMCFLLPVHGSMIDPVARLRSSPLAAAEPACLAMSARLVFNAGRCTYLFISSDLIGSASSSLDATPTAPRALNMLRTAATMPFWLDEGAKCASRCSHGNVLGRIVEKALVLEQKGKVSPPSLPAPSLSNSLKNLAEALGSKRQLQHAATRAVLPL